MDEVFVDADGNLVSLEAIVIRQKEIQFAQENKHALSGKKKKKGKKKDTNKKEKKK
jgi:hypothetical protein